MLQGETHHVQGVDRMGDRVYVTSVERAAADIQRLLRPGVTGFPIDLIYETAFPRR